jgi:hypothetical protein
VKKIITLVAIESLTLSRRSPSNGKDWVGYLQCTISEPPLVKKICGSVNYFISFNNSFNNLIQLIKRTTWYL